MMKWYISSLILFIIGITEFFIHEYQRIVLVRLKTVQATIMTFIDNIITFIINVYFFKVFIDFYACFRQGIYDYIILMPFIFYIFGCTMGTTLSLIVYKFKKKETEKSKRLKQLEKARKIKKEIQKMKQSIIAEVETEFEFEENEQDQSNKNNEKIDEQKNFINKDEQNVTK